tara:strand:- start:644 stop:1117 length:474 start_codon:yes stop_codon:yes gene_type:complete
MSHSITAKLNQAAREHAGQNGVTFFVSLGEKNYDFKTKQNVWTNYDAALFAKDAQIEFYRSALVEHAIIEVSGTGIIVDDADKQYKPKLMIQDAKLGFVHNQQAAPQQANTGFQQQAPTQGGFNNQQPAPAQQQGGFQQQEAPQQAPNYPQDDKLAF